ncbi:MAG: fibronectin type III domain-containing protein [Chitinophagaceae bacterium]|nr:fibronectin type III domain-containing protein [Chitinophagaceae bacterium]MCW5928067.1 fibronectin type III domain-containing protein [Chitinophagaceae bacterium]
MIKNLNMAFLLGVVLLACARPKEDSPSPQICNAPSGLSSSSITASGAVVSWSSVSNAISYDIQYKVSSSNTWTDAVKETSSLSVNLSGLLASTSYNWRVKSNCASGASSFSSEEFTTIPRAIIDENGIASQYPGDENIGNDPDVLYVEQFNDGMENILSRYDDKLNVEGMSLESDVPAGSTNAKSIKMTSITGGVTGGGHLYKEFKPGFEDVVYVRYYVKYPSSSKNYFHHESVWFGGYNPSIPWPYPRAGTCGLSDERLSICCEPIWQNTDPPGMDSYIYWGDMKMDAGGKCWGNVMITEGARAFGQPAATGQYPVVKFDEWMCVEVMVKLNNPVNEYNGELAIWVDGVKAGHWGPGFPNGSWNRDKWYNNPVDPPFQGFRWRTNDKVNINWLWFEYYHENPAAPSSHIKFANLVMAKKYIGPIKP